jgi:hypothetical protein
VRPPVVAFCLPQPVVRRSGRIPKEIPILLIGSDLGGKIFSEPTKTVLLSLHGAGIISKHKLSPEQEMVLRWPERNKEAEIRVVGQIGADSGYYTYGVAFFDTVVNFWEMEFSPPSPKEQEFGLLSLVCNVCQTLERLMTIASKQTLSPRTMAFFAFASAADGLRSGNWASPAHPPPSRLGPHRHRQLLSPAL